MCSHWKNGTHKRCRALNRLDFGGSAGDEHYVPQCKCKREIKELLTATRNLITFADGSETALGINREKAVLHVPISIK